MEHQVSAVLDYMRIQNGTSSQRIPGQLGFNMVHQVSAVLDYMRI